MAPVTRSKASKASANTIAAPTSVKKKVGKVQKAKRGKKAITAKISKPAKKVQGKKKPQKKSKKIPLKLTTDTDRPLERQRPEPDVPEPLEEDWELAESYRILPYLDSPDDASSHGNIRPRPVSRGFLAGLSHITATPPPTAVHPYTGSGFGERPRKRSPSVHFEDTAGQHNGRGLGSPTRASSKHSSSSSGRVKLADIPVYAGAAASRSLSSNGSRLSSRSSDLTIVEPSVPATLATKVGKKGQARRRDSSVVREILAQVPDSSPPTRRSSRRTSSVVRGIVGQVQRPAPKTPVSVSNAQVFKRPTVATVRRERAQMVDELNELAAKLVRARQMFEEVIESLEDRVRILKAVNRMQAPLKKAPLGRGRKRG